MNKNQDTTTDTTDTRETSSSSEAKPARTIKVRARIGAYASRGYMYGYTD